MSLEIISFGNTGLENSAFCHLFGMKSGIENQIKTCGREGELFALEACV